MSERLYLVMKHEGARLCCVDFGGDGAPALLLHGLAGRGNEWYETAQWLREHYHVYALDQRGHGRSSKGLDDYSRDVYVNDAACVIEQLGQGPVVLVGQSLGGQIAYLVAARRPELVQTLIVVEAGIHPDPDTPANIRKWLNGWPLPFPSLAAARAYFGGDDDPEARAWIEVLEERDDGYWPQFEGEEMVSSVEDQREYGEEWARLHCPTLLVSGEKGYLPQAEAREMLTLNANVRHERIPGAGHMLHLSHAHEWRKIAETFLREL
ncbi:alpha/beta fold hydrolase [Ktedonospora formicarum]|uniref:alpha/beta fold hydrolase n=1 Tax=Ktedonospora formicarum TaxID=2778364 RepID=UPI001C68A7EA|nr:alpha/beta hydrolase [Ktedonospora formicarum]